MYSDPTPGDPVAIRPSVIVLVLRSPCTRLDDDYTAKIVLTDARQIVFVYV